MAKITPFKALVYNQEKFKDLSRVTCPPYDVISPEQQQHYHEIDAHNLIHILLSKDVPGEDKYKRAGTDLKEWIKNRVLTQDERPAIYFYSQQYNVQGEKKTRLGFISLLHLADKNSNVFRHEFTRLEPKEDRFKLIKQVKANLSPIFVIFLDKKRVIQRIFQRYISKAVPFIDITDEEKTVHKLWRIDSPETLDLIQSSLGGENIFIADGHHRYEVACAYRDEMQQKVGVSTTGEESFNYIMAYFTNTDHRGLTIFPIHRLLKLDSALDLDKLLVLLDEYFDVEEIKDKTKFFFLMEKAGSNGHILGMYKNKRYFLLGLKNVRILDKILQDRPKDYRSLDVCILNYIVFEKALGLDLSKKDNLKFSPHANEFISAVDNNQLNIAFFLNPVKIEQIISVALNGERMPPKSTYFYPKVLSGLVINKLNEDKA